MVLAWIASSLSDDVLLLVIHCTSAREIWTTLDVLYGTVSRSRVQSIKRELHSLAKGTLCVTAYIHNARTLSRTLALAGEPVSDTDLIFLILTGLPTEFDSVVAAIHLANPLPSLDSVAATVADFEQRLKINQSSSTSSVAFVATSDSPPPPVSQGNRASGRGSSRRGGYHGNKSRASDSRRQGQPRAAPVTGDSSSIYCYKCGYPNHKANVCEASSPASTTAHALTALQISNQTDALWYPDSGASHHMTADPSLTK
ncbi:hypothetical protein Droror1_Dr00025657, partial [Drosera rotundifolia]